VENVSELALGSALAFVKLALIYEFSNVEMLALQCVSSSVSSAGDLFLCLMCTLLVNQFHSQVIPF